MCSVHITNSNTDTFYHDRSYIDRFPVLRLGHAIQFSASKKPHGSSSVRTVPSQLDLIFCKAGFSILLLDQSAGTSLPAFTSRDLDSDLGMRLQHRSLLYKTTRRLVYSRVS